MRYFQIQFLVVFTFIFTDLIIFMLTGVMKAIENFVEEPSRITIFKEHFF